MGRNGTQYEHVAKIEDWEQIASSFNRANELDDAPKEEQDCQVLQI